MSECDQIGIGYLSGCGWECRVFLRGECDFAVDLLDGASEEERQLYVDIYGEDDA